MAATSFPAFPIVRRPRDLEDVLRAKRLRSLLALFTLYTAVLLAVTWMVDGADLGCILAGIAGHVLYATARLVGAWRDAAFREEARARAYARARMIPA
jgi:hypothetical protein